MRVLKNYLTYPVIKTTKINNIYFYKQIINNRIVKNYLLVAGFSSKIFFKILFLFVFLSDEYSNFYLKVLAKLVQDYEHNNKKCIYIYLRNNKYLPNWQIIKHKHAQNHTKLNDLSIFPTILKSFIKTFYVSIIKL